MFFWFFLGGGESLHRKYLAFVIIEMRCSGLEFLKMDKQNLKFQILTIQLGKKLYKEEKEQRTF